MTENQDPNEEKQAGTEAEQAPVYEMPDDSDGYRLAERAAWHLLELQGEDVQILDMRGLSDVCDFFVLGTGTSDVHVRAVGRHVQDQLLGVAQKAAGVEGLNDGRWALLDYFDVVVHVFQQSVREYFHLERLWGDAARLEIQPEWFDNEDTKRRHAELFAGK